MANGIIRVPEPSNEPVRAYAPGSAERASLKRCLQQMQAEPIDIPLILGGRGITTGRTTTAVCPHDHGHVLATVQQAGAAEVDARRGRSGRGLAGVGGYGVGGPRRHLSQGR